MTETDNPADSVRPLAEVVAERDALAKLKAWQRVTALDREIHERTTHVELAQDAYYYGTAADARPRPSASPLSRSRSTSSSPARQTCRGHLERGESYTVGTLPNGEIRPYETEIFADGRRFHYCVECAAEPRIRRLLLESSIRVARREAQALAEVLVHDCGTVGPCWCFGESDLDAHVLALAHLQDLEAELEQVG